jgi:hypothetical protein
VIERAHVVEPVAELDQDDPDVAGHGQEHLAEVLRLALLARAPRQLAELGHAVDQEGDLLAEDLGQLLDRGGGVLDRVVQEAGAHARHVQLELRDDVRHRQRMGDVRVARLPHLALVRARGELVRAPDQADVSARVVRLDVPEDRFEASQRQVLEPSSGRTRSWRRRRTAM